MLLLFAMIFQMVLSQKDTAFDGYELYYEAMDLSKNGWDETGSVSKETFNDNCPEGSLSVCWRIPGGFSRGSFSKSFSTVGSQDIYIKFSFNTVAFGSDDTCDVIVSTLDNSTIYHYSSSDSGIIYIYPPLPSIFNNYPLVEVTFYNSAFADFSFCYIDNVYIYGSNLTTTTTVSPTIQPTINPTVKSTTTVPTVSPVLDLHVETTIYQTKIMQTETESSDKDTIYILLIVLLIILFIIIIGIILYFKKKQKDNFVKQMTQQNTNYTMQSTIAMNSSKNNVAQSKSLVASIENKNDGIIADNDDANSMSDDMYKSAPQSPVTSDTTSTSPKNINDKTVNADQDDDIYAEPKNEGQIFNATKVEMDAIVDGRSEGNV